MGSANIGKQFGDRDPITDEFLKWVEREDLNLVERLAMLDAPKLMRERMRISAGE